eukprot:6198533-Pleurochrysis_carterae.AAC.5
MDRGEKRVRLRSHRLERTLNVVHLRAQMRPARDKRVRELVRRGGHLHVNAHGAPRLSARRSEEEKQPGLQARQKRQAVQMSRDGSRCVMWQYMVIPRLWSEAGVEWAVYTSSP